MRFKTYTRWIPMLIIFVLALAACQSAASAAETHQTLSEVAMMPIVPSVSVSAQEITDNTVTMAPAGWYFTTVKLNLEAREMLACKRKSGHPQLIF